MNQTSLPSNNKFLGTAIGNLNTAC